MKSKITTAMKHIITISREYGSGGMMIGKAVAERFGIPFYDKNVAELSAEESEFSSAFVESSEDKVPGVLSYSPFMYSNSVPVYDKVFLVQSDTIRKIAEKGPCVIVGRCSDYVLRERPDVVNIFIHAPMEDRIRRVMDREGCTKSQAEDRIRLTDRRRASYHNHYAQGKWGVASNYHLTVDSSVGIEKAAEIICAFVRIIED